MTTESKNTIYIWVFFCFFWYCIFRSWMDSLTKSRTLGQTLLLFDVPIIILFDELNFVLNKHFLYSHSECSGKDLAFYFFSSPKRCYFSTTVCVCTILYEEHKMFHIFFDNKNTHQLKCMLAFRVTNILDESPSCIHLCKYNLIT